MTYEIYLREENYSAYDKDMNISLNQQIIVAGNTCEGAVQNVTKDNILNLSCIPLGSIVLFFVF